MAIRPYRERVYFCQVLPTLDETSDRLSPAACYLSVANGLVFPFRGKGKLCLDLVPMQPLSQTTDLQIFDADEIWAVDARNEPTLLFQVDDGQPAFRNIVRDPAKLPLQILVRHAGDIDALTERIQRVKETGG
jgi:hypothetical protein